MWSENDRAKSMSVTRATSPSSHAASRSYPRRPNRTSDTASSSASDDQSKGRRIGASQLHRGVGSQRNFDTDRRGAPLLSAARPPLRGHPLRCRAEGRLRECLGFVEALVVLEAVLDLSEEFVEQVSGRSGVTVTMCLPTAADSKSIAEQSNTVTL